MDAFEKYWLAHIEEYKALARAEFNRPIRGPWHASIFIDSDDDFTLDIDHSFEVYANCRKKIVTKLIDMMTNAKFKYSKTWSIITDKETRSGSYDHAWFSIRDEAIKQLLAGASSISYGGNQTIEITISKF